MKKIEYDKYGPPLDVLQMREVATPSPGSGQVLVKVKAVGLNPRDTNIVKGKLKFVSGSKFPKGIGADFAGVIEQLGPGVTDFKIGDSVLSYLDSLDAGALAEYLVVDTKQLSIKPAEIDYREAAALPCTYLTAWEGLVNKANLQSGQSIMIYGASGGVGTAAVQIAKYLGAHVTSVSSKNSKAYCSSIGADIALAYDEVDVFHSREKYDVFFQVYSDAELLYDQARSILKPKGTFLTLIPNPLFILKKLFSQLLGRPSLTFYLVRADKQILDKIVQLTAGGKIKAVIFKEYDFDQSFAAIEQFQKGLIQGKIIINVNR